MQLSAVRQYVASEIMPRRSFSSASTGGSPASANSTISAKFARIAVSMALHTAWSNGGRHGGMKPWAGSRKVNADAHALALWLRRYS